MNIMRIAGTLLLVSGFGLICASPYIVTSDTLMLLILRDGFFSDGEYAPPAHVRWLLILCGIGYAMIIAGVYLLQRAKSHKHFVTKC